MSRFVSKAELARLRGVSKPAITKACRGPLAAACDRDRVDLDHPLVVAYLDAKPKAGGAKGAPKTDGAPTETAKPVVKAPSAPTPATKSSHKRVVAPTVGNPVGAATIALEDEPKRPRGTSEELASWAARLRPISRVFGTGRAFRDYLLALKELENIEKTRLDNGERAGRLISRGLVQTHMFAALDGMSRLLLTDSPKTIARRAYAMAKAGATAEEGEKMVKEIISSQIVHVRDKVLKALEQTHAQALRDAAAAAAQEAIDAELDDDDP